MLKDVTDVGLVSAFNESRYQLSNRRSSIDLLFSGLTIHTSVAKSHRLRLRSYAIVPRTGLPLSARNRATIASPKESNAASCSGLAPNCSDHPSRIIYSSTLR